MEILPDDLQAPSRVKISELITLKAIKPIKALQKPQRKRNPGTNMAASPKIIAFKIKRNKPKVKNTSGKVKKPNIGRKIALRMPKTAADINALPKYG